MLAGFWQNIVSMPAMLKIIDMSVQNDGCDLEGGFTAVGALTRVYRVDMWVPCTAGSLLHCTYRLSRRKERSYIPLLLIPPQTTTTHNYSLFILPKPRSPSKINGQQNFLKVNRL